MLHTTCFRSFLNGPLWSGMHIKLFSDEEHLSYKNLSSFVNINVSQIKRQQRDKILHALLFYSLFHTLLIYNCTNILNKLSKNRKHDRRLWHVCKQNMSSAYVPTRFIGRHASGILKSSVTYLNISETSMLLQMNSHYDYTGYS